MLNVFTRVDRSCSNARVQGAAGISTQLGPGVRWQVGPGMHQVATHATIATNHRLHQPTYRPICFLYMDRSHLRIVANSAHVLVLPLLSHCNSLSAFSLVLGAAFKENYSNGSFPPRLLSNSATNQQSLKYKLQAKTPPMRASSKTRAC